MKKKEVISFKADQDLIEALAHIPNRSAFIRKAVENALDNLCPLCGGRGTISPEQQEHWDDFLKTHHLVEC